MELAQGLGLHVRGVGFPGHFMVKVLLPKGQVVMDPTTGQSLSREDLSERLEPHKRQSGLVDDYDVPLGLYLQAATPRDIIARMLRNLKEVHRSQQDWQRLTAVLDRLVVLSPQAWGERRGRGLAHAELGNAERSGARPGNLPGARRRRAGCRHGGRAVERPAAFAGLTKISAL